MFALLSTIAGPLIKGIFSVLDATIEDKDLLNKIKLQIASMDHTEFMATLQSQTEVIKAEANSDSWIAKNWRPITMLVFLVLVVSYWFGITPAGLSETRVDSLFELVKIGLGGYVVGRSAEKVAKIWKTKED